MRRVQKPETSKEDRAGEQTERERQAQLQAIRDGDPGVFASSAGGSFQLELDLRVHFTPLMADHGQGISLTRTIHLPFPPSTKIAIGGVSVEGVCYPPMGYRIHEVMWDVDRHVFLARTDTNHCGDPIAMIPHDLQNYIDQGWRIGSWRSHYDPHWKSPIGDHPDLSSVRLSLDREDEFEAWETQRPKQRPAKFNRLFEAVIRMLLNLQSNESIAYAMYKSKMYIPQFDRPATSFLQPAEPESPEAKRFSELREAYWKLKSEERERIQKNILRRVGSFEAKTGKPTQRRLRNRPKLA